MTNETKKVCWLVKAYYKMFLIPESMIAFISGIFISVSTGILTVAIPDSLLTLGANYIISAVLMFIASIAMMIWSVCIKSVQDAFSNDSILGARGDNDWYGFLHDQNQNNIIAKVNACFFTTLVTVAASVVLWIFS